MQLAGIETRHVALTGSTNADLLAEVRDAAAHGATAFAPRLLVAAAQSAGRGRHGRAWRSAPGASLLASLAWPFPAGLDLSGLSLAAGVAVAEALDPAGHRIGLKWPNDLLFAAGAGGEGTTPLGRKLAGILIETAPIGAWRVAVVGLGLNVGAVEVGAGGAASGIAWLGEIDPGATPRIALERIAAPLAAALARFEAAGFAPFAARFAARDALRGRRVQAGARGEIEGVAAGVSAHGELVVQAAHGPVAVTSGEVRLRVLSPPAAAAAPC